MSKRWGWFMAYAMAVIVVGFFFITMVVAAIPHDAPDWVYAAMFPWAVAAMGLWPAMFVNCWLDAREWGKPHGD